MDRPRITASILAYLIVCALSCSAQIRQPPNTDQNAAPPVPSPVSRTYSIRGTLRKSDTNQPAGLIQLDLIFYNGERAKSVSTLPNGEFEFVDLKPNTYFLSVEVDGYDPIRERVDLRAASKEGLTIFLKKPAEARPDTLSPTISAHLLALPQKAQETYQKGIQRLYEKKDLQGALQLFQRAVSEAPNCYEAIYQIGVIHAHLKQFPDAEIAYRKSIELSQDGFAQAYVGLAEILSNTGKFAEAEPMAVKAAELQPDMWEALLELARAQVGLGKWETAEKTASAARKLNASVPPLYIVLANIHIHKADYPAAVDDLEAYLRLQPDGPSSAKARTTLDEVRKKMMAGAKAVTPPTN